VIVAGHPALVVQLHGWRRPGWSRGRRGWRLCLGPLSLIWLGRRLASLLESLALTIERGGRA